jgi:hypothetical protein
MSALAEIMNLFGIDSSNVKNVYRFGSRVYGTNTAQSDHDFIIVRESEIPREDFSAQCGAYNATAYSTQEFQRQIDAHEISVLECLWLGPEHILLEKVKPRFNLDKSKLRASLSARASNSWVKAKKKLTVSQDFNEYIAKKSLFHSFRILSFGIQIATKGQIVAYDEVNNLWQSILENSNTDWEYYYSQYHQRHNRMQSEFRKVAPKESTNEK